jgi:predicted nucleic acid-binding protein
MEKLKATFYSESERPPLGLGIVPKNLKGMRKNNTMARNLLLDTGFWYALYDSGDTYYENAQILAELLQLDIHNLIIPWPCLYETLNTRFVKRRAWFDSFAAYANRNNTLQLPDEAYRQDALMRVFRNSTPRLSLSLVDEVIRSVLLDTSIKIDAIVTFNPRYFSDICYKRNIELIFE